MVWGGQANVIAPRSRPTRNLAVAVSGSETAPFFVDSGQNLQLEMCKAGKVQVPIKLVRHGDFKGNVAVTSTLPPNAKPTNITLDANTAAGNLEINLPVNVPTGTYTFSVLGTTQVSYSRDPEALKAATDRKAAVDKIVAELAAAAKVAVDAKATAEKKGTEMVAAAQKARQLADVADEQPRKRPPRRGQRPRRKPRQIKRRSTQKQAKAAAEAKAAADKAAAEADAKAKEATAVQQAVAKTVTDATNKSKPANINLVAPSPTVTLKVTSAPIAIGAMPASAAVKQSATAEIPVTITRLYSYADPIQIKTKLPAGVAGIKIAELAIPAGQTQGKLVIEAAADATPGTHAINVQAVVKFNGQELSATQDVAVTVQSRTGQIAKMCRKLLRLFQQPAATQPIDAQAGPACHGGHFPAQADAVGPFFVDVHFGGQLGLS